MNTKNQAMKTAILYARTAYRDQDLKHSQLEGQIKALQNYCAKNQILVTGIYAESGSGLNPEREKYSKLVKDLKKGKVKADQLLVQNWDRLSRNFKTLTDMIEELETSGIIPIAITDPLESDIMYRVARRLINRRTKK